MVKRINLSLCMITCNDEKYIRDSVTQFKGVADEVIIADIGSMDHTMEIAKQEGAQIYPVCWNNDFGEVKNFLMDHAGGRWVLFLQPNEKICAEHRNKLLALLDNPNAEGYLMLIDYSSESFRISSPVQTLRLVRHHKENRYGYRSFECIQDEILTGVANSKIEIVQLDDAMFSWELNLRTMLLQQEVIASPQDGYLQYMLGIIKLNQQSLEESITCFENARSVVNSGYLFSPHLYKCLSWAYLSLDQNNNAINILDEGIDLFPLYSDLLIIRAEIYRQLQQHDNAIRDIEQCLRLRECPALAVPAPEISDSYAIALLGEICEQIYDVKKALCYYIQAYQLDSADTEVLSKIGEIIEMTGAEEAAEDLIRLVVEQQKPDILYTLLNTLQRRHAYSIILSHMDDIAPILGIAQAKNLEISCRLMIGDIEDVESDVYQSDIMLRRIENCWIRDNWPRAEELLVELKKFGACGWSMLDLYADIHQLLTGQEAVEEIMEPEAYDTAASIYDDFLWKGQVEKARILLPMLLNDLPDDRCIQLAFPWTKIGDFEVIRTIFLRITSNELQHDFIQKMMIELLRHGYTSPASRLKEFWGAELSGELDRLLWASLTIQKLGGRITDIKSKEVITQAEGTAIVDLPEGLTDYYLILCSRGSSSDKEALTAADIHEKIGDVYMRSNKQAEAFSAYLKALQAEPWNFDVQQKTISLLGGNAGLAEMLRKFDCTDSGSWIKENSAFISFIAGLRDFYCGLFKQAQEYFSHTLYSSQTNLILNTYVTACIWFEENQSGIRQEQLNVEDPTHLDIHACLNYVLSYLRKEIPQFINIYVSLEEQVRKMSSSLTPRGS